MKMLILTDVFFPDTIGGAGRVVFHIGLGLSRKGHDVHILTRNAGGRFVTNEELAPRLYVHRFSCSQQESPALFILEIKRSYDLAKQLVSQIGFDVISTHQSLIAIGPLRSKRIKELPLVYHYHSPWHEEHVIKKSSNGKPGINTRLIAHIIRWMEKNVVNKADKVVVLSDYMKEKVSLFHNCPEDKIIKIPGGVDLNRFHLPDEGKTQAKENLHLLPDKTIFLTIRNLVPRMGLENLIRAFNGSDTLQTKALLLIGGKGPLEKRLHSMAAKCNIRDSIRFLGHVPDNALSKYYQAADFFILPTAKLEGFGLVILEAMASGTPVLGTPVGAIPEVIGPFEKKLLFDSTTPSDIRKKMEDLIHKPYEYHFSPHECRRYVETHFAWERVVDRVETVMKELRPAL
jgi:glycosyltransferase involved in cell wall biosynthesis